MLTSAATPPSSTTIVSDVRALQLTSGGTAAVSYLVTHNILSHVDPGNPLAGAPIVLTLNVSDGRNTGDISIPMAVLAGDTTANRAVSNTDVAEVKAQVSSPVNASNFRTDINANGVISNTDVSDTKAQVSTSLP